MTTPLLYWITWLQVRWQRLTARSGGDTRTARAAAEAKRDATMRATALIEALAPGVAELHPDEFAERVAVAFGRPPRRRA